MFAEERRAEIAKLVSSARRVNGADLARRYDVTMETVRRDLAALEEAGKLRRVHGGAVTVEQSTSLESSIASRQGMNTPEKRRIAAKAYEYLRDSDVGSIVLDAGSTIEILADYIGSRPAATASLLPMPCTLQSNSLRQRGSPSNLWAVSCAR